MAGAAGGAATLAGCGGFARQEAAAGSDELTFTTWGTDAELAAFERAIAGFQEGRRATVTLDVVPYAEVFENLDARLQAGTAPDIFRTLYSNLGVYAGRGQLLDLGPHLDGPFGDRFTAQMWAAVQYDGTPYAVPHVTDTSTILYNRDAFAAAGITAVPETLEQAWTWEEFDQVALQLRAALPADRYPFVCNWQASGVTRWLSWLFQADGRLLADDLLTPAIDSDAGRAAVDVTRSFFARALVPPNNSVKSPTFASDLFFAETASFAWVGTFLLPDVVALAPFEVGATYQPRGVRGGSDLGGNPVVANAETTKPELAAEFLAYLTEEQVMLDFCTTSSLLPTLTSLVGQELAFDARPDLSRYFVEQASTVQPQDAAQVASVGMQAINEVIRDQLEEAFIGGRSTDDTIAAMTEGITRATAE